MTTLADGSRVHCLQPSEAKVLDGHIEGYMNHGIRVEPGHVVFDVGANIGLFGLRMAQRCEGDIRLIAFEPIPDIRACTEKNSEWPSATVLPLGCLPRHAVFTLIPTRLLSTREGRTGMQRRVPSRRRWPNTRHAPMWYARLLPRFLAGPIARYLRKTPSRFTASS